MTIGTTDSQNYSDIADAIRTKGIEGTYTPAAMANAILSISGGGGASVSGVKGDAESTYRTGNVNLTPGNLGAVSVSGDTMTGSLTIKDNNIDITTTPSSSQYDGIFEIHDSNDKQIMNITAIHTNNGYHGFSIGPYDSDTGQQNALQLTQNNNDNYRVWISQPAAWRSALSIGTIGTKDTLTESDIPNIAASKIDSGTLAITYGGTGKTTATEAWTALGGGAIGKKATLSSADIPDNAADTSGNAGTATKLATARSLYVALGTAYNSSSPVTFDGSAAKALPINGTLAIAHGGTGKTTATEAWTALGGGAIGKKASLTASDIPSLNTSKLTAGTLGIARGGTGSSQVVSILANSTWTIYAWGPLVMVQCHGAIAAANNTTMLNGTLASYKPAYNASTIVADTSASNHVARMYVEASSGSVKLASVGYTTSAAWYGTLVYMRA